MLVIIAGRTSTLMPIYFTESQVLFSFKFTGHLLYEAKTKLNVERIFLSVHKVKFHYTE
jgi:ABC-type microcin C transport system permease subunit YejB